MSYKAIDWPIYMYLPTNRPTDQLDWSTEWLWTDWRNDLSERLIDWLASWLTVRPTDNLSVLDTCFNSLASMIILFDSFALQLDYRVLCEELYTLLYKCSHNPLERIFCFFFSIYFMHFSEGNKRNTVRLRLSSPRFDVTIRLDSCPSHLTVNPKNVGVLAWFAVFQQDTENRGLNQIKKRNTYCTKYGNCLKQKQMRVRCIKLRLTFWLSPFQGMFSSWR